MKLRRESHSHDEPQDQDADPGLVRSEEQLEVDTRVEDVGAVRLRRNVDSEHVRQVVTRGVEHGDVERTDPVEGDSGQVETLPDGSVSVPVFEEQIVVEKRLVVRERIIIRKSTVNEEHVIEADLRSEHVDVEVDDSVQDRVHTDGG